MRSVTSYFNPTLYRKNLSRFWPLWVSWLALWLFLQPIALLVDSDLLNTAALSAQDAEYTLWRFYYRCLRLPELVGEGGILFGAAFAVVCALAVFGYLFNHRSAAAIHALPMRRETLFVTNYLSGLTMLMIPNLVVMGCTAAVELALLPGEMSAQTLPIVAAYFWSKCGCELFLFSFAVFCTQFTGNAFALPAFYAILNGLVAVMYELVVALADSIYYGFATPEMPKLVEYLTPVYALYEAARWHNPGWREIMSEDKIYKLADSALLGFQSPATIAVYAAVGVALSAAALLLYRRRHIETAGDVVSVKAVRPIFRVGVAVCAGLSGGILIWAFFGWDGMENLLVACMLVWTVIGYFVAEMLLQKSFRVFKKAWKGCVVTALVCTLVFTGMVLDVLGVETRLPDKEQVQEVYFDIWSTYPYDSGSQTAAAVTDPAMVEEIVDLHKAILSDYAEFGEGRVGDDTVSITLQYLLKDGSRINRQYYSTPILRSGLVSVGEPAYHLNRIVNDPDMIRTAYDLDFEGRRYISHAALDNVGVHDGTEGDYDLPDEYMHELWEAVQLDFAEGTLGRRYLFDDEVRRAQTYFTDLRLYFYVPEEESVSLMYSSYYEPASVPVTESGDYEWSMNLTVTLTPDARHTLAVLEQAGMGKQFVLLSREEAMGENGTEWSDKLDMR